MRLPGVIAVVVLASLALLVVPAAAGAATWSASEAITSPGDENTFADLALGPDGTVIAVWQRMQCTGAAEMHKCENGRVQYSVRPPGGSFSEPVDMPGDPFGSIIAFPEVAVDAAGNAIAIWSSGAGELARLRYSIRPAGGEFGGAKVVPDPVGTFHVFPSLALAPDGRAIVTFSRALGGVNRASYAIRAPGGNFDTAQSMVGDPGGNVNQTPEVHLDSAGGGIAIWSTPSPAVELRYAVLAPGANEFGATQTIEPGNSARLAMAPSGAAVMIWNPSGSTTDLRYAFRSPGGNFGAPNTLFEPDNPLGPRVAIAPDGSTVAAWSSLIESKFFARWAAAPFGGPFGALTPIPPGGPGVVNDLAMSDRGTALALWVDETGLPFEARASLRPPEGVFGAPTALPGPQAGAALGGGVAAFNRDGNYAAVLWNGRDLEGPEPHDVPLLGAFLDATEAVPISGQGRPSITRLRVQPRRFRVGGAPTAQVSRKAGTTIRFRLSERATVSFVVQRRRPGIRVRVKGKVRCLPPTRGNRLRALRKGRCVRFKRVGRRPLVRRNRPSGANRIGFSGRVGRRALRPGPHRIVAVAVDEVGERSLPRRAGFRVLRLKRKESRAGSRR